MTEQWKPIRGYEGLYEVSDHGRIKSLARKTTLRTSKGISERSVPERIMKPWKDSGGRAQVYLADGDRVRYMVGRTVLEHFRPSSFMANLACVHIDFDKFNNHIDNLRWSTPSETAFYMSHGEFTNKNRYKYSQQKVISAARMIEAGRSNAEIAHDLVMSKTIVSAIRSGKIVPKSRAYAKSFG